MKDNYITIERATNGYVVNFDKYEIGAKTAIAKDENEMLRLLIGMLCHHYSVFPIPEMPGLDKEPTTCAEAYKTHPLKAGLSPQQQPG